MLSFNNSVDNCKCKMGTGAAKCITMVGAKPIALLCLSETTCSILTEAIQSALLGKVVKQSMSVTHTIHKAHLS